MAAQLGAQSEWKSLRGNALTLAIPASHKHLADKVYADKLKAAIEAATGRKLLLAFEIGEGEGSLAAITRRDREQARAQAEAAFRNEPFVRDLVDRFGATVHPLLLANSPDTLETRPLATWSNLESALDALSGVMNKNEDILVLYLTSHGDPDHNLLVDMDPLPLDQIGAPDLAGILAKHPFKWKVVVVNACYSGGFVPPLKGPGTLVLTAARADRSSFGCGSDSDITYFGRAWLVDAMNRTADFIAGFQQAKGEIAQWETRDHLTPSEPQIDVGAGIADQLARWRGHVKPGAAVAFEPSHGDVPPAAR